MSIRSILSCYTGNGGGPAALHMAILMAQKYDARITGALWQAPNPLRRRAGAFFTREIDSILDQAEVEQADTRRTAFMAAINAAGLADRADFTVLNSKRRGIAETARAHDVIVMGSNAPDEQPDDFTVRPDVVALRSGRPVVIVPHDFDAPAIVETAVVAWDGKRASARALSDAMHILGTKDRVTLLAVGDDIAPDHGQDALRLLALHGVEADVTTVPPRSRGIGRTILDACDRLGAGLLIMGAYEHSKFSEDLLGGVTRDILENARLPVLMAH